MAYKTERKNLTPSPLNRWWGEQIKKGIMDDKLKNYMEEHFGGECFTALKKAGLFQGIKRNEYEKQAERICKRLGIESIYDSHLIGWGTPYHISWANDPNGFRPFVEVMGEKMHNSDGGKVIELKRE